MRKVIFTAILLLVLGTAWTLYLAYDNKRLMEVLPQPPSAVKPMDEMPIDSTENSPGPSIEVENTQPLPPPAEEQAEVKPTTPESAEVLTVEARSETTAPSYTENSEAVAASDASDDMTEEKSQGLREARNEERDRALAVINRLMKTLPDAKIPLEALQNPEHLRTRDPQVLDALQGKSKGQVIITQISRSQSDELFDALDTLKKE